MESKQDKKTRLVLIENDLTYTAYGYQPDVQFREGKHPTINTQLILDKDITVEEIEGTFEALFVASGADYESYYD